MQNQIGQLRQAKRGRVGCVRREVENGQRAKIPKNLLQVDKMYEIYTRKRKTTPADPTDCPKPLTMEAEPQKNVGSRRSCQSD